MAGKLNQHLVRVTLLGSLFLAASPLWAAENPFKPRSQTLPAPRVAAQPEVLPPPNVVPNQNPPARQVQPLPFPPGPHRSTIPYSFPRVSKYAVWQNYAVDQFGRFRPVVIYAPSGAYYNFNHAPYPWMITHNWEISPFVVGSPAGQ